MTRDYASSGRASAGRRKDKSGSKRKKPAQRRRSAPPPLFVHGPSVSLGVLLGAAGLALILWLPEWLARPVLSTGEPANQPSTQIDFDYRDILQDAEVETTEPTGPNATASAPAITTVRLQAGAFRNSADADRLRASLLLLDLPVTSVVASLSDGDWHRVMVGPFDARIDAQRAMTRLREQNLTPIWLESSAQ